MAGTEPSASNPNPDWTVGALWSRDSNGIFYVEDVVRFRGSSLAVERAVLNTASHDGKGVRIEFEQEPGSSGKALVEIYARKLAGYIVHGSPSTGDKLTRAKPASSQAEAGNVVLIAGKWNDAWLKEHENFPSTGMHDDQVDTTSNAVNKLSQIQYSVIRSIG